MTSEKEKLELEIKQLTKELKKKEKALDNIRTAELAKVGYVYAGMNIKRRKASYLITRPDGKAIVLPIKRNAHNERNVHWYVDGKKGDIAIAATRQSSKKLAIWLKNA